MTAESNRGILFIHLHAHSAYSLSEGALPIKQMAKMAREAGMPALAITDKGNLFGALEFSEALAEKGIQPIIGSALKVDFDDGPKDNQHRQRQMQRKLPSLVLLAKNEAGYRNLMRLSSRAFLDTDDAAEPHVAWEFLTLHSDGLICLTGGPLGPVNDALVQGQAQLARERVEKLNEVFGD